MTASWMLSLLFFSAVLLMKLASATAACTGTHAALERRVFFEADKSELHLALARNEEPPVRGEAGRTASRYYQRIRSFELCSTLILDKQTNCEPR